MISRNQPLLGFLDPSLYGPGSLAVTDTTSGSDTGCMQHQWIDRHPRMGSCQCAFYWTYYFFTFNDPGLRRLQTSECLTSAYAGGALGIKKVEFPFQMQSINLFGEMTSKVTRAWEPAEDDAMTWHDNGRS
ncbi:hypothetical protein EI94DRAFT_1097693 [Lactarius quietus]|nr:hypothetical protein EI94DRAFT_1097693 [Lactarius quietus]